MPPARDVNVKLRAIFDDAGLAPRTRVGFGAALSWGAAVGLAMSTQLLFQPFIWRHYAWDEVLDGWLALAGERLAVTSAIALALAAVSRVATPSRARQPLLWRAALLAAAILFGALAGEALLLLVEPRAAASTHGIAVLTRIGQWAMLAGSISSLWYLWCRNSVDSSAAQAAELRRIAIDRQVMQARLQALRSQIEPHFLFNTLATVRRLHRTEHDKGAQLLVHFLEYLRSALPERPGERRTLGQEIDLVQAYLGIVAVRMAGRLTLAFAVPAALRAVEFPALTVATLVENAIKHGIGPSPQGGEIAVRARLEGEVLEVVVADTGVGFSPNTIGGVGIGLANIRWRLAALYGNHGSLVLGANVPSGVCATMRVPTGTATAAPRRRGGKR